MKKKQLILSAILAFASLGAVAAPVTRERAVATAKDYIKGWTGVNATVSDVYASNDSYYVVNLSPQGWVIVSGDDCAEPIIGYSLKGALPWHAIPSNMKEMLTQYGAQVKRAAKEGKMMNRQWSGMNTLKTRAADGVIGPLIKVSWGQSSPFNTYCPGSGSTKALVGCVAVAMSQAMSVQQYPSRPTGMVNYTPAGYSNINMNFDAEKAYDWSAIMSGANKYDEAARLMYHAGVSVKMMYGSDGSGVLTSNLFMIRDALVNNFSYGNDVQYYTRSQYEASYGKQGWIRLLLNELTAGRAIVYNGTGTAGHSFNVDGHDGVDKFHINWGWTGTGDGYFSLDNLYDAYQGIEFPNNHTAIIGIGSPNRELRSVEIDAVTIEEGLPAGTVVANISVNGTTPKPNYTFEVRGMYHNGAYRKVPFTVQGNKLVTTESLNASTQATYDFDIIVSTTGENPLVQTFTITVEPWKALAAGTSVKYNRATGEFSFKTMHNVSYTLTSPSGTTLANGTLTEFPSFTINKSTLATGKNTLTLRRGDEVKTLTLIK